MDVNETLENITAKVNGTKTEIATQEGLIIAYISLIFMAIIPIYFGSYKSVEAQKRKKVGIGSFYDFMQHVLFDVPCYAILLYKCNYDFLRNNLLFWLRWF